MYYNSNVDEQKMTGSKRCGLTKVSQIKKIKTSHDYNESKWEDTVNLDSELDEISRRPDNDLQNNCYLLI